uniref:NADAR domain-containing protein n=1 Tax=Globodera rostochiensis TaxID=31243 RepID=A0A914H4G1_GLORO
MVRIFRSTKLKNKTVLEKTAQFAVVEPNSSSECSSADFKTETAQCSGKSIKKTSNDQTSPVTPEKAQSRVFGIALMSVKKNDGKQQEEVATDSVVQAAESSSSITEKAKIEKSQSPEQQNGTAKMKEAVDGGGQPTPVKTKRNKITWNPTEVAVKRRSSTRKAETKDLRDNDKAMADDKEAVDGVGQPTPVKTKRNKILWNPTEVTVTRRSSTQKPETQKASMLASISFSSFGMSHEVPRRTPLILTALDGCTQIAPFFTNAFGFSNHFACRFTVDGLEFCCTEQFYMYYKARIFGDEGSAVAILRSRDPKAIKQFGAQIRLFDTALWRKVSILVMLIANWKKFEQNPMLRQQLFETGDALLVEASPSDIYWGIGIHVDNTDRVRNIKSWQTKSKNVMGRLLTRIRDTFKEREQYQQEWEEVRARLPELHKNAGAVSRRTI